jgi:hypothetical protein
VVALYYDASQKQNKQRFENDPNVKILCAVEDSIIEGFNMQMASRIIRTESLWSPGEVDQMTSRIFRPDVNDKFGREYIELDWIFIDGSMECAKVARLVSKTLAKTAFDEYGNHLYDDLTQLPKIRMTLDTFRNAPSMGDFEQYFVEYGKLVRIRNTEFKLARDEAKRRAEKEGRDSIFIKMKSAEVPDDFRMIRTPIFPGQQMPDPLGHDYDLLANFFNGEDNGAVREQP